MCVDSYLLFECSVALNTYRTSDLPTQYGVLGQFQLALHLLSVERHTEIVGVELAKNVREPPFELTDPLFIIIVSVFV
jgi:hypothetical protein